MDMTQSTGATLSRPPQLDSIETTAIAHLPTCYADLKRAKHAAEYAAVETLYGDLDHDDSKNRLSNLHECRQYAYFARHSETGKVRVISNSCRLRWCPVCSEAKRARIRAEVSEWLSHVRKPKFITLTMSHVALPLSEQIAALYRGFRLLRQHKAVKQSMRGGIWFVQIKRSETDGCWHPHLHIIADSNYIDKRVLSQEWFLSTGNSYIIDIRAVQNPQETCDYVSRYCAKPCKLTDYTRDDRIEIATVLHGKRLCGRYGTGRICHFKTERPADFASWQRLGSWRYFIDNRPFEPAIQQIIKAWHSGTSIERSICETFIHEENPCTLATIPVILTDKQRQLVIENWSSH